MVITANVIRNQYQYKNQHQYQYFKLYLCSLSDFRDMFSLIGRSTKVPAAEGDKVILNTMKRFYIK